MGQMNCTLCAIIVYYHNDWALPHIEAVNDLMSIHNLIMF